MKDESIKKIYFNNLKQIKQNYTLKVILLIINVNF
jgi:hypothetical protein